MPKLYTKNMWTDEILAGSERYEILENDGTPISEDVQINLTTNVAAAGSPVTADRMNNIENGIDVLDTILDKAALNNVDTLSPSNDDFFQRKSGKWVNRTPAQAVIDLLPYVYPVGSIYISVVSTNPATLLGFGTWTAFATGRTLVGIDTGQTEFDTVEETGGAKTHALTEAEMPTHTHVQNSHNHTQNAHTHTTATKSNATAYGASNRAAESGTAGTDTTIATSSVTPTNNATTATNQNTGGGEAHNNLQPYIVVYMWKRTA